MKSVRVTIHLRDNSTKELTENVLDGSGDSSDLKTLVQSLTTLQSRVNSCLTELVEQERGTTQTTTQNSTQSSNDDGSDCCYIFFSINVIKLVMRQNQIFSTVS